MTERTPEELEAAARTLFRIMLPRCPWESMNDAVWQSFRENVARILAAADAVRERKPEETSGDPQESMEPTP